MTTEIGEKLYTVEEFLNLEWDEDDDTEYELIGGRIVARPGSGVSAEHGRLVARISTLLENFGGEEAGEHQVGVVYTGGSTNLGRPKGSSYVEPDVCFVLKGRTPEKFDGPIPVAPDIVVEVWSPSDTTEKIQNKIEAYQQAGVPLIWSVYMLGRFVLVYTLNDPDIKLVNISGELDGGEILPDFKIPLSKLFK